MDTTSLLIIAIITLAVNIGLMFWVISSATETKKKIKYDEIKIKLLMKIAEANGVKKEEIDRCLNPLLSIKSI